MKTKLSLFACILFFAANTFAQHCYEFEWAFPSNGTILKAGSSGSTYQLGTELVRRSATGQIIWTVQVTGQSMAVDQNDNVYVVNGVSLIKINSSGETLWQETLIQAFSQINDITLDNLSNIYLTGMRNVGGNNPNKLAILKLNSNAQFQWTYTGSGLISNGYKIITDDSGNLYVSFLFKAGGSSALNIGNFQFYSYGFINNQNQGQFSTCIAKFDNIGNVVWAERLSTLSGAHIETVENELFLTGTFYGNLTVGNSLLFNNQHQNTAFLLKFDESNNLAITKQYGSISTSNGIKKDVFGNVFLTGENLGKAYIAQFNTYGEVVYSKSINDGLGSGHGIDISNNKIYITGTAAEAINYQLGNSTITGSTHFVAKLDTWSFPQVTALASSTSIECSESTFLNVQLSQPLQNPTYQWFNESNVQIANQAIHNVSPTTSTVYKVIVTGQNQCFSSDEILIEVLNSNQQPMYIWGTFGNVFCSEGTTLETNFDYQNIVWSTNETTSSIIVNQIGTYTVSGIVPPGQPFAGCLAHGSITLIPFASINSDGTIICDGQSLTLPANVVGNPSNVAYFWNTGANTQSITVNTTGTYSCQVVTADCSYTATAVVTAQGSSYTPLAFTHAATGLTVQFNNIDPNANTVSWNFGDGNTSTQQNPTHTFSAPGTYNVCFNATNFCGQSGQTCSSIAVQNIVGLDDVEFIEPILVYPNPASQSFTIANAAIGSRILVYDITGKIVFEDTNSTDKTTINSSNFVNGVYFINVEQNGIRSTHKIVISK